jgi:ribosomal protein S27AE
MHPFKNDRTCPKCLNGAHVREKRLLIEKASPKLLFSEEKAGYQRKDQLAVDECKSEMLKEAPLEQFVDGYYCGKCGIGFVPDSFTIRNDT